MHRASGLSTLTAAIVAVLAAAIAVSPRAKAADDLPNYLAPPKAESSSRLSARDVVKRVFQAPPGTRPEFEAANLGSLDLAGLDFKAARLTGANFHGTDLTDARLVGADLAGADLDRATITATDFSNADLTGARLYRPTVFTSLTVVENEAPKFTGARMVGFRTDGQLDRANFAGADLSDAVLGRSAVREPAVNAPASLVQTNFTRAILLGARLADTALQYARFTGADLRGADLSRCDLLRADFSGADLAGTDFTGANLDEADLRGARGIDKAIGLASALNLDRALRDPVR